jgi:flagellar export protein FliJ
VTSAFMSKLIKNLDKLLRFKKQNLDTLRLQLSQKQQEIEKNQKAITEIQNSMIYEQGKASEFSEASVTYSSFLDYSRQMIAQHQGIVSNLEVQAEEILKLIQEEFSESKAYETVKENELEKIALEEKRQENDMLDDINQKKAFQKHNA